MEKLWKLSRGSLVLVCDGRKAIFLVNDGAAANPELSVSEVLEAEPSTAPNERPGRRPDRVGADGGKGSRSAMETPDPHQREEDQFVLDVAQRLERKVGDDTPPAIVIAAAPDVLGKLRKHLPQNVQRLIKAEFAKDLTNAPVSGITAAIFDV